MLYMKVLWKHQQKEYPIILFSELTNDRFEVRKVDVFFDGSLTYACNIGSTGETDLCELPVPSLEEIANNDEFEPIEISKHDFEDVWYKAISSNVREEEVLSIT